MSWGFYGFRPYVSVAERRAKAARERARRQKKGEAFDPIALEGRAVARTFWGKAWCDNLESYSDYENRLPRGRSYVRNGSVMHLEIRKGEVKAMVMGSQLYTVSIDIAPVDKRKWKILCKECAGGIGSLIELMQGRLSERVMGIMTRRETGLFPAPSEIKLSCSCPDWAEMCKHVAAALYGVGARLDEKPELLFLLRHADHRELVSETAAVADLTRGAAAAPTLSPRDVGSVFGIELAPDSPPAPPAPPPGRKKRMAGKRARRPARKKQPVRARTPRPGRSAPARRSCR